MLHSLEDLLSAIFKQVFSLFVSRVIGSNSKRARDWSKRHSVYKSFRIRESVDRRRIAYASKIVAVARVRRYRYRTPTLQSTIHIREKGIFFSFDKLHCKNNTHLTPTY